MKFVEYSDEDQWWKYYGETKNEQPNGNGTMFYKNGDRYAFKYEGEWSNGKRQGVGSLTYGKDNYHGRKKYLGEWKEDKFSGTGLLTWQQKKPVDSGRES